jgi:hypothetical protein
MQLSVAEGRVLGCLIEKQVAEPDDSYSLGLDELRFSCNQTSGRDPVVAFDDRTVEDTVLSLKAMGLARFVTVGHRARPLTYRHRADERWRLGRPALAVLAHLLLRGPQTVDQIWALLEGRSIVGSATDVEVALDTLAGRTPTPLAARLARSSDGPEGVSWVEVLTGRYTLDQPRPDRYDAGPTLPSRRGSGLPAREPWRPDERLDARGHRDGRDAGDLDPRDLDARDRDRLRPGPAAPQGRLDLADRQGAGDPRDQHRHDPQEVRDRRPEPADRGETGGPRGARDQLPRDPGGSRPPREAPGPVSRPASPGMPHEVTAGPGVPVAVPANQARPEPTLTELAERLSAIERRLAAIEGALAELRAGGGPPPSPSPAQPPPRPQGPPGQPPRPPAPPPPSQRQPGPPSRPAPSRPHR